jgi:hypothetical protein
LILIDGVPIVHHHDLNARVSDPFVAGHHVAPKAVHDKHLGRQLSAVTSCCRNSDA